MKIPEPSNRFLLGVGVVLMTAGISAAAVAHPWHTAPTPTLTGSSIDLLQQDWQQMEGVTQVDGKLAIASTGLQIVQQDGSGGQANPPLNLYGTYLKASGDFRVTVHLTDAAAATADVRLYDTPPIIADEFRVEPASIAVSLHGTILGVQAWNGSKDVADATKPKAAFSEQSDLTQADSDITISKIGNDITVQDGQTIVTARGSGKSFRSGAIWLGLDSPDGSFTVDKFTAQAMDNASLTTADTSKLLGIVEPTGLQAAASALRPGFKVGAAAALGPLVSNATYRSELLQNFGSITLENAMKPEFLSPKHGVYTFQQADALIALAHENGMTVHGHTLAFSEAEPTWMRNLPTATDADRQQTAAILLDYVRTVVTHFKGQLDSLDVINEPLDTDQGTSLQQNIWYKAMGADYMVQVSQLVHSVDPDVKQYVNENGAEMAGDRQDALLALIQHINAAGGFIYGVGLQAHVYDMSTDTIDASALNKSLDRFGANGLKVRISENDVTDDSGTAAQAAQYSTIFATCLHNANCVSYTTWGVDDSYDWFADDDGSLQQGHDFLFNNGKATAALTAIRKILQQ